MLQIFGYSPRARKLKRTKLIQHIVLLDVLVWNFYSFDNVCRYMYMYVLCTTIEIDLTCMFFTCTFTLLCREMMVGGKQSVDLRRA